MLEIRSFNQRNLTFIRDDLENKRQRNTIIQRERERGSIIIIARYRAIQDASRWRFWECERSPEASRKRLTIPAMQRSTLKPINSNKATLIAPVNCSIQGTTELLRKHYRIIAQWNRSRCFLLLPFFPSDEVRNWRVKGQPCLSIS